MWQQETSQGVEVQPWQVNSEPANVCLLQLITEFLATQAAELGWCKSNYGLKG